MNNRRVFVTAIGGISALGLDIPSQLRNLLAGTSGLDRPHYLPTLHQQVYMGEVKASDEALKALLNRNDQYISRASLLALKAAGEALNGVNITSNRYAIFSGNTGGGMSLTEQHYLSYFKDSTPDHVYQTLRNHHCADSTEILAREYFPGAINGTLSTACSSSANALLLAARLIRLGKLDAALAGGVEALSLFTLNGFRSLKIMEDEPCRPFDTHRKGLNLGEGAAFFLLESEEQVARSGNQVMGELVGWANANDAFHETATSPEGRGAAMAMRRALEMAGISPSDIGYINAHGTGTENNDATEAAAVATVFGERVPVISSTKGFTGHTLGAAGALEACFALLAMREGKAFANVGMHEQDPAIPFEVNRELRDIDAQWVMSNSFGFGGNATSIVLKR